MGAERYSLQRTLPSGHMSEVWLAYDQQEARQVVVKIMKVYEGDPYRNQKTAERFAREIAILQDLSHPQILPLLDSGHMLYKRHNVPYLVSPYIPEGSLATLMNRRPPWQFWSLRQVADAVMQAANCLWYLHCHQPQIVHEDIKPGNFLYRSVNTAERVVFLYLFDFGISRYKHQSFEMASEVVGTPAFMAPEQIEQHVHCASDQYALAVMACVLLTGQFPVHVDDEDRQYYLEAHLYTPPQPPSALLPERLRSEQIDNVFLRALEKNPERRFPTVLAFAEALRHAISAYGEDKTEPDPVLVVPGPRFSPAFDASDSQDHRVLDEPLPIKPPKAIAPDRPEGVLLAPLPVQGPLRVSLPSRPKALSWCPDGAALACVLYGAIYIYRRGHDLQLVTTLNAGRASVVSWSADSRVLAVAGDRQVCFWDVERAASLPYALQLTVSTPLGMDWSHQDQLALWLDTTIWIYHLPCERLLQSRPLAPQHISTGEMRCDNVGTLLWSPDGTLLASGSSHGEVVCWPVGSKQLAWQVANLSQKIQCLAWSRDGSLLLVATQDRRVLGRDVQTQSEALHWEKLPALPRLLTISRQGHITLASSEKRLLIGFAHTAHPSLSAPGQLLAAWSPGKNELATLDDQDASVLNIWSIPA
ncbi:WD40 repeat domain-containing serine/threonine protein kinase [Dictyobacter aurantiacus]|uniref:non-specific serine/threonine protein kinase n=1 Tax=Dictyobacter aurantiacus TaxID=1936993 RepID=A0A401ZI20_9CHLR|nr:WD40 repeat domain-containing serine/threonine protein kinase [Dictyobacter aurantiacus]GCE06491.1 hypothetical protein KDAU_38200 [Dictyobacter aurantiacus]